ncbi:hypothetical protein JCGZ_24354 [Jatropha curcas]|uniref:Uncharacterized protein n=1 Tax=Jatropha curcas TaxID=180498 RepID=A0A067LDK7_JATCU|nr:hypothetical protein JCGZ_24354 [Jatropha curcas]
MTFSVRSEVKEIVVGEAASEKIRSQTPAKDKCCRKNKRTGLVTLLSRLEQNRSSLRLLCHQVNDDGEGECGATPLLRPPGGAGEPRRRLRRGSDRGKVAVLPTTVAFARNERREGRRGRSCSGEEATARRWDAEALILVVGKTRGGEGEGEVGAENGMREFLEFVLG